MTRLQKALASMAAAGNDAMYHAAVIHSRKALSHAQKSLVLSEELASVRKIAEEFHSR